LEQLGVGGFKENNGIHPESIKNKEVD